MNKIYITGVGSLEVGKTYKISSDNYENFNEVGKLEGIVRVLSQGDWDASLPDPIEYHMLHFIDKDGLNFSIDADLVKRFTENGLGDIEEVKDQSESQVAVAIQLALDGMFTDGAHHKQWYLNQIVKALMTPGEYAAKVVEMAPDYGWDEGLAP